MSINDSVMIFLGFAALLLLVTTLINAILIHRHGETRRLIRMNDRIAAGWSVLFVLFLALLTGPVGVTVLFALCAFAALREFFTLLNFTSADHWTLLVMTFIILPLQFLFVALDLNELVMIFIPVCAYLLLPFISALRGRPERFLGRVAGFQFAMMIAVYAMSYLPALLFIDVGVAGGSAILLLFLILITELFSVLQFLFNRAAGQHLIAPSLSHAISWEGLIGGGAITIIAGGILSIFLPFNLWAGLIITTIIIICAFAGTIIMRAIKRSQNQSDLGYVFSGYGGILDRFEALLFAAPIYYHIIRVIWG